MSPERALQYVSLADGKGVAGDCKSEGSLMQILEPTNRNFIRGVATRMMLHEKQKSNTARIVAA